MARALVREPDAIRLAMVGMVPGNGHPYSWSAIINGRYDEHVLADCGYPVILEYLRAQPASALGIQGARVTHVWCDDADDARRVASAAYIPNIVPRAEDVIGQVDAVIIPTDVGSEHLDRARPFVEAGIPLFVDKPLTDRADHLAQFVQWFEQGRPLMSTSCMRYAREYAELRSRLKQVGQLRWLTIAMAKTWERYGIHAIEAVYPFLTRGGWLSVANSGTADANIVHLRHRQGVDVVLGVIADLVGPFGQLSAYGTQGVLHSGFSATFDAFKRQLQAFISFLRTGQRGFDYDETVEQMRIVIAGMRSRAEGGRLVKLDEIGES